MEIPFPGMVFIMVMNMEVGDDPQLAADFPPSIRERVILAPPTSPSRPVIEQVDMGRIGAAIDQFGISPHELVDCLYGDLQEPCRHQFSLDAAILPDDRPMVGSVQEEPHIFLLMSLEAISSGDHVALGIDKLDQIRGIPRHVIVEKHDDFSLMV